MALYIFIGLVYIVTVCYGENIINFQLMEEMPLNSSVGSLATNSGLQVNMTPQEFNNLRYSFLDQTDMQNLFNINDKTGDLQTKIQIDREHVCDFVDSCVLKFDIAIHSNVPAMFKIYSVQITLLDKNDHSPKFPSDIVNLQVLESSPIGTSVTIDDATDLDSSPKYSVQSYEIVPSNSIFRLDSTPKVDGGFWLNLVLLQKLDREILDNYQLQIVAKDGGFPPNVGTATVNVEVTDDNDNSPVFVQDVYNISIAEGTASNTAILAISATDKDIGDNGKVTYSFSSRQNGLDSITSLFSINETTGFLSVIGNIIYEAGKVFKIYVEASDHGTSPKSSQATVHINIMDTGNNQPIIRINFISLGSNDVMNISESSNIATLVASLNVEDPDTGANGNVSCSLSGDFLSLQPISNKKGYLIMIKKKFDREKQDYHNILVTCQDQGSPVKSTTKVFHVRVLDDNDCTPEFLLANYFASMDENNLKGTPITKVSAKDDDLSPNNDVQYFLDSDAEGRFAINSVSGVITANTVFDREQALNYKFTVLAVDSGNPPLTGTASVILTIKDVNDNAPYFDDVPFFQFFVKENADTKNAIDKLTAHDKDEDGTRNSDITFSLDPRFSDANLPFIVYPQGNIYTNMKLDRERQSSYQFTVIAKDQGTPQLSASMDVKVYVSDDNDNRPNITFPTKQNNTVKIPYSVEVGTMITQVKAVDLDETGPNSQLSYRIKSGNEQDVFMIGSTTGKIYLKRTYEITSDKMFPLNIVVNDNGKIKLNSSETLRIVLLFANMTTAAQDSGSGNRNIIISIVVIALTVVISAAMIAIILILRYKDKQDKQQSQKPLTYPQITPHEKLMANGLSKDMDMQLKKKKEVSFSIDEDLDNMELYNTSSTTASGFNDFEKQHEKYKINKKGIHVELPEQKVHHNFDNISELSDEATNSDSGHGSSDVDITNQSNGAQSDKFAPKSVRLQPVLSAKCQSPIRADDVLTIVTNNGHRNSFDNSHRSLILDGRKKSGSGAKSKDNWVPSYV
ncbi:protocadherin-9-like [Mytilus edulis]|uniref:protocadherin-9-like n=1 Tax=Mytilus edulis TaxID=6550 RepID=UPI0039EE775F